MKNLYNDIINIQTNMENLNREIIALKGKVDKLEKENVVLKQENVVLKGRIVKLEKDNTNLKAKILFESVITSLQDLNEYERLEEHLNNNYKNLREYRNTINHYIRTFDTQNLIEYKKLVLYKKLLDLPNNIKEDIEDDFGTGLIDTTIEYLSKRVNNNVTVTEKEKNKVDRWWI